MHYLVFLYILFVIFSRILGTVLLSKFRVSEVVQETGKCMNGKFNRLITKRDASTRLGCALLCNITEHCRRFMYRPTKGRCVLYHSGENCLVPNKNGDDVCYRLKTLCEENMENCTRCPFGYYGNKCENIIQDCSEAKDKFDVPNDYLQAYIRPAPDGKILEAKCEFSHQVVTVIQYRDALCTEVDFNRQWIEYKNGFGDVYGEYWLGLTHLHAILQNRRFKLTLLLESADVKKQWRYNTFNISGEDEKYAITIDDVESNNHEDLLTGSGNNTFNINGIPFSTTDDDNGGNGCPHKFQGGWWYIDSDHCGVININGKRLNGVSSLTDATIHWWYSGKKVYNMSRVQLGIEKI